MKWKSTSSRRIHLKKYPTVKDQSDLWSTTLLYSAAKNNHLKLAKYLIKKSYKYSVNAQNQQHIMRVLPAATITDDKYDVNSTALHRACYNGHLEVVKFLTERGANYFIINHIHETSMMNASFHPNILQYFRDFFFSFFIIHQHRLIYRKHRFWNKIINKWSVVFGNINHVLL